MHTSLGGDNGSHKPARLVAQVKVFSRLSPSQLPGSNLVSVVESTPPGEETRGRSREKTQRILSLFFVL